MRREPIDQRLNVRFQGAKCYAAGMKRTGEPTRGERLICLPSALRGAGMIRSRMALSAQAPFSKGSPNARPRVAATRA